MNTRMNNSSNIATIRQKDLKVLVENSCLMEIKINQMLIAMIQIRHILNRCFAPMTSSSDDTNINIRSYFPLKDETKLDYVDTMILENAAFKNQLVSKT